MMSPSNKNKNMSILSNAERLVDKASLLKANEEASSLLKRQQDDDRKRAMESIKSDDAASVIIMPKYIKDERLKVDRETFPAPPEEVFIGLGWDEDSTTKRKHYR